MGSEVCREVRRRLGLTILFGCVALGLVFGVADLGAQTTNGRISGTVLDSAGSPMKDVTVTATNQNTGLSRSVTTDQSGAYVLVSLPRGTYLVTAEANGFKKVVHNDNELVADGRVTVDFHMEVGDVAETLEITARGEAVNTVSGEIARTVDREQVQNLALNGRNYLQLATLIPGAPLLESNYNALDIMTGLGINMSVNGGRGNSSSLTVDGEFNMDSGSNNSQVSNVGIDFIEEVNVKTANFSAEYGRNSGAQINVVTRSGGNNFKGSVYEYHRGQGMDANDYINNLKKVGKAPLKYNDFGWSLGGPIMKDKLFFFAGQEWKQIDRLTAANQRTLPTVAERNGDFSGISTVIKDPLTGLPFPGNIIPASRITPDGRAIANVYTAMQGDALSYTDKAGANNALFQDQNPFRFRQELLRVDYQPSTSHRLTFRGIHDIYDLTDPFGTFITSDLPTVPTDRNRPGNNYQFTETWFISPMTVNEFKAGASWHGQRLIPVGTAWERSTYGFQFPQLSVSNGRFENSIPDTAISGYAGFKGAAQSLIAPTTDIQISDNLTLLKGNHTFKVGALYTHNRKDQNGRPTYAGNVSFSNNSSSTHTTGDAFADALLGNFASYSEAQADPYGFFRFSQIEGFVSDNWRVSQKLSLDLGLRYCWQQPMFTQANNIANFDPSLYNPSVAMTVNPNGTLVPGSGNRYNGIIRAGDGVPDSELGRVPLGNSPTVLAVPAGAPRGFYKTPNLFAPRFSFAWSGDEKTSVRGGAGLFFDRPEGNIMFGGGGGGPINTPPYAGSASFTNGNLSAPGGGTVPALAPFGAIGAIDPNLQIPRTWNWSLSVQRELGRGIFAEVGYVGSKGSDLLRDIDINLPTLAAVAANAALPSAQKASLNFLRPFKGYSQIFQRVSDGDSKYNALQLYLSKRQGALRWTLSYTLSRSTDNGSSNTAGQDSLINDIALNRGGNEAPSDYDRKHVVVGTFTWQIPVFKKHQGIGAILGGWEISGIGRLQSGAPFSVIANSALGTRLADYNGGNPYVTVDSGNGKLVFLDKTAFAAPPENRLGTSTRNEFRGPGLYTWDMSLRKQFAVKGDTRVQLQADFFNVFNHTNLRNPISDMTNGSFGVISQAVPPRNVQIGARITF
jgi:hypothetical protein